MSTTTSRAADVRPPEDLADLPRLGGYLAERLRGHFPAETERDRQVLALAEEAGEFVGAYRRAAGMARRTGEWDHVRDELADVAITAYVTATALDVELRAFDPSPAQSPTDRDRHRCVMEVAAAAGWVVDAYLKDLRFVLDSALAGLVMAVHHAAHALGIDLDAAVRAKAEVVCTRGWRDHPTAPDTTGTTGGAAPVDLADLAAITAYVAERLHAALPHIPADQRQALAADMARTTHAYIAHYRAARTPERNLSLPAAVRAKADVADWRVRPVDGNPGYRSGLWAIEAGDYADEGEPDLYITVESECARDVADLIVQAVKEATR